MKPILLSALLVTISSLPAYAQNADIQTPPATNIVVPEARTPPPVSGVADGAAPAATTTIVASVPPAEDEKAAGLTPIEKEINEQLAYLRPTVNIETMPSLFFSIWEHDLVRDARRGLNTRDGSDDGVDITGPRDISLGGIVYASGKDWTIWLNNIRISPNRIPSEVMDLKVYSTHIDLEWFDAQTNQIFPIRLRPHQRFNLDTRIFLPG
ncbi:MAG TPA: hypothetical protein VFS88_04755 [Micavibrio sp.]|nr:hypothetical protein [Micavibrio sp.]